MNALSRPLELVDAPVAVPATRAALVRRARRLAWVSLVWMMIEGAAGLIAGALAGSVALTGFGLDSMIEAAASVLVVWRFTGKRGLAERAERRARRGIAICFFALALYLTSDAIDSLLGTSRPDGSWLGIAVAATSLVVMPSLARAKFTLGAQLGSGAVSGRAPRISYALSSVPAC
jgi:divalent metal cation (Fe/Co/Zn/Cd) transporter